MVALEMQENERGPVSLPECEAKVASRQPAEPALSEVEGIPALLASAQLRDGLFDARQRGLPSQDFQRLEQRRGVLAAADGDANGLEHLSRFDAEIQGSRAQGLIERVVFEFDIRQHFL